MVATSIRDTRRLKYRQALNDYGFLVLTGLIGHFESSEDYEECQMIKEVIEEANEQLGMNYPTEIGDKAFDYYETHSRKAFGHVPKNYIKIMEQNMTRVLKMLR